MASDSKEQRDRRRRIFGAGVRSLGRSVLHTVPGYDRARSWQKTGQDWFDTLGHLKGAAMKLGQIASQYRDFLPEQLADQLARLQRDAEPWDFERLEPVLADSWSDAQWADIETIEPEAMAAASIGQVHVARLVDGRTVAVKIRYPGVADAVDADIANLGRLLKLSRFLPVRGSDIDALLAELRDRFIEETDYRHELSNLLALRAMALPEHRLPEPVTHLCGDQVLVTTLVHSDPIARAPARLGQAIVQAINLQVFTHGGLHADPHPGNFGVTEDQQVALYDFGCVKFFDTTTRAALRDVIAAALDERWRDVHDALERLGVVSPGSWDKHGTTYAEIYARHAAASIGPLRNRPHYVFADDGLIESIRAEIRASLRHWKLFNAAPDLVFLMRTLSGLYWILRAMNAEADLYAELEAIAAGAYGPPEPG
ncbi:AarF/ABC1/UbiB kinase family protein [Salinisphaera sp. T31B1]|uniref:ABC1 kinase family protein n=1 Tax=Salinisphaera sp. T31B1 TaxID=727963 RepID=UPI003340C5B3